jgi:hypothetical protein
MLLAVGDVCFGSLADVRSRMRGRPLYLNRFISVPPWRALRANVPGFKPVRSGNTIIEPPKVRFGSLADITAAIRDVRLTPKSGRARLRDGGR